MKLTTCILTVLWLAVQPAVSQDAAGILSKAADLCRQSSGITASFTLRTLTEHHSESIQGVIHIKGDKFALLTPEMKTWYDGKTQWTYLEQTGEVNVSAPEGDELQFTNPAILLESYEKDFMAVYTGEVAAPNGRTACGVELKPRKRTDIVRVDLQIEKASGLPVRLAVQMKNNASHIVQISEIKTRAGLQDAFFTFPQKDYPQAEIIDLR
ncbi:MAG: hypothetical protein LBS05_01705 [Tannerellaceae bacterium]|jgi:outer membrane lipoprotein-sorting protein|nr:hypothetical protein [Tannerellaceae bacterium]